MKKELLAIFNKLRVALNFPAIAEDKHEEFSIEKEFIEKAQAAVDASATLQADVTRLTAELATANTAKATAESALSTEVAAHAVTKAALVAEKAAHAITKGTPAAETTTVQQTADEAAAKKATAGSFDPKADRRKSF